MDNKRKKKNKQNPNGNKNENKNLDINTEIDLETLDAEEKTKEQAAVQNKSNKKNNLKIVPKDTENIEIEEPEIDKKETEQKDIAKGNIKKEDIEKDSQTKKTAMNFTPEQMKETVMNAAKILLPVAACAIIVVVIISYIGSQKSQTVDNPSLDTADHSSEVHVATLSDEPLEKNAYTNVNELMQAFCTAMADGDMDTVRALKDYNTDKEIITYQEKSGFIERYDNINCYTKPGIEDNSYFVYVTYDVKFKDIETEAPGLNAFYVYTSEDGSLKIDGDTEENIKAAFKLVTSQDDVVDLYNKINVSYNDATVSDDALGKFMEELPATIRASVGVALAQLETQGESENESGETPQTEIAETQPVETEIPSEEPLQNQVVNQIVRTTDTVNVRSSDSEEADRIGKAQVGTELRRIEERINGWSKVIFEDREAYIKSDYLEVVTNEVTAEPTGVVVTASTNVNVRSQANQESERLGSAQAGSSYSLLEDQGEWYKIDYNGTTGYVKAEFFER